MPTPASYPRWLGVRTHAAIHATLTLASLLVLPLAVPAGWTPPAATNPLPWLLALVGYPGLIEPRLPLDAQSRMWSTGYGALVILVAACGLLLWRRRPTPRSGVVSEAPRPAPITPRRRLHWLLLAFVPSSLLLGVTTFLSSEIAAVPLFWVVALALYLLTFILAFARQQLLPRDLRRRIFPLILGPLFMAVALQSLDPARRRESLTYFHRTGPIGPLLELHGRGRSQHIAVVGLGAGSLVTLGLPDQEWTFHEIDPAS